MSKRRMEVGKVETIFPDIEDEARPNPLDNADNRLLDLLGELEVVRNEVARACPRYVHALRQWANLVKQLNDDSVELCDALLARAGVGEMTDRALRTLIARTEADVSTDGPWTELVESAESFYMRRAKLITAQSKVLGYIQYLESSAPSHDVPTALYEAMEAANAAMPRGAR